MPKRKSYFLEVRWPASPTPFLGCPGRSQHPPRPARPPPGSQRLLGSHPPLAAAWPRPALALEKVSKRRCSALISRGRRGPVVRQPMSGAGRELKGGGGGPRSDPRRPRPPQLLPPPVLVRRARVSAELQPPPGVGAAERPPPPRALAALSGPSAVAVQGPCGSPRLRVSSRSPGLRRSWTLGSQIPLLWSLPS